MPARVAVSDHAAVFSQYHKVTLTDECGITHATNIPRCHFKANAFGVPSNPEGAPAGGISALVYGIVQPSTGNIHPKRNDPRVVPPPAHQPCAKPYFQRNFLPPEIKKTSPESTRPYMAKSCFALHDAGALGGSSRRVWEVWRERESSFKRTPSPSKVFSRTPPRSFPYPPSAS